MTLPVALDVGRATFAIWNSVEWLMMMVFGLVLITSKADIFLAAAIGVLDVLMLIQSMVLLPALNVRIATIMAGGHPPSSSNHLFYIAIDVLKLFILAAVIWKQSERLAPLLRHNF